MIEKRTITQVKLWMLWLNPIFAKGEVSDLCAVAYDKETLQKWMDAQKEDQPYKDAGFWKRFKLGSELEMYNGWFGGKCGINEQWMEEEDFNSWLKKNGKLLIVELDQ
jgi:hypothetical protein